MERNGTDAVPCRSDLTIDELVALLNHIDNASTTPEYVQPSSSRYASFVLIIVVSSVVIIVNLGSLLAIYQAKKITAYLRLVISLSISDILVGIRVLFGSLDIKAFSGSDVELCAFVSLRGIKMTSHLISLFNLLGLGLDHYCAIIRPLKYKSQMSDSRTNLMIITFWIVSTLCGFSDFFVPAPSYKYCHKSSSADENSIPCDWYYPRSVNYSGSPTEFNASYGIVYEDIYSQYYIGESNVLVDELNYGDTHENNPYPTDTTSADYELNYISTDYSTTNSTEEGGFCYSVMCSRYDTEYLVFSVAALLLIVMTFIYTRVCTKIYSMRHLLRGRSRRTFRKNKRGLITTMCIVGSFMICWLPFGIFSSFTLLSMRLYPQNSEEYYGLFMKVDQYLYALLLLNSLCDPIIYALRMREVKIGYSRLIGRCCEKYKHRGNGVNDGYSSSYQLTSQCVSRIIHPNNVSTRFRCSSLMGTRQQRNKYNDSLRIGNSIKNTSPVNKRSVLNTSVHGKNLIIVNKGSLDGAVI